jgi:membrane protease YdiL (CAAX protease family)
MVPILIVAVIEGRDMRFMGFFFPSLPDLLLFTLAPYTILLVFSLLESWYRVTRRFESLDVVAPLPMSYPREVLDQALSVAFPEEVLHRGYLLPHLLELLNPTFAIGVSATIFSLLHVLSGGRYRALRTVVDGVILGTVFMYAGLLPCILVHFAGNLITGKVERTILGRTQR